jgi:hypothetical protein
MAANLTRFRAQDWVEVRSPLEIASTLDEHGTLDGLPFMPEMSEFCGRRFRVLRIAEKTCIEFPGGWYKVREFRNDDVLLLEGLRCSGAEHDGCQRMCTIFWKAAWLRKVMRNEPTAKYHPDDLRKLLALLKTKSGPSTYFCQSTQLAEATLALTRKRILKKCYLDLLSGSRGFFEMIGLILAPLWRKATRKIPRRRLVGEMARTPVGNLNLQPGERVMIKPAAEIAKTLDARGRNRGLVCDFGMTQYSGGTYCVRSRVDRMISESTAQMRQVQATVILDGLNCLCWQVLGGCPRQEYMYWREVWLDRAETQEGTRST